MKKYLVIGMLIGIISFTLYGCSNNTSSNNSSTQSVDEFIKQQKAKGEEIDKQYKEQIQKIDREQAQQPQIQDKASNLEIQDGHKTEVEGDYIYVRGRVKNIGKTPISYWKLTVEYLGVNGNVLNTSFTTSLETMQVGNMKEFEIMHKNQRDYAKTRMFIEEAR